MKEFIDMDTILGNLDKKTLDTVVMGKDISSDTIPTASYGINRELNGGFRLGHQHTIYGAEGCGKTAFMLETVGVNQKLGVPCVWYDTEGVFDPAWAARLGVDVDKLVIRKLSTISQVTDDQVKWINAGVGLIVIDSTSNLMQSSFVDDKFEVKSFDETKQLGSQSKDLGKMSKMVQGVNFSCAVVHISQVRIDVGAAATNKPFIPIGGKEIRHNDSIKIRLAGTKSVDKQITGEVRYGDVLIERQIGYPVNWKIEKNRLNGNEGHGVYNLYKAGDKVGVDRTGELVSAALEVGVIQQGGAWFTVFEKRIQGAKNVVKYLEENPELLEKIEAEVDAKSF